MTRRGIERQDENDEYSAPNTNLTQQAYAEEWRPRPVMVCSEPLGLDLNPEDEARRQELTLRLDCSYPGSDQRRRAVREIPDRPAELTIRIEIKINDMRTAGKWPRTIAKDLGLKLALVEAVCIHHGNLIRYSGSDDSFWYGEQEAPPGWRCQECGHKATWINNGVCRVCFLRGEAEREKVLEEEM